MRRFQSPLRIWFPLAKLGRPLIFLSCLALETICRADLVYLKDGYVLEGKVKRDHQLELDPATKEPVAFPRGLFQVDDGCRRVHFLPGQARIAERDEASKEEKFLSPKVIFIPHNRPMPSIWEVLQVEPWDDKWERGFIFNGPTGKVGLKQHLGAITPTWARVDAINRHRWGCMYLTREFDDLTLRALFDSNPETLDRESAPIADRITRKLRRIDFWLQAGRFSEASKEADSLGKLGGDASRQSGEAATVIKQVKAREELERIKRLIHSHQFKIASKLLASFPEADGTEKVSGEFRALRADMDALSEREREHHELFLWLESALPSGTEMKNAIAEIKEVFHADAMDRLESFLGQARAVRKAVQGPLPPEKGASLAALAMTGWSLGNAGADPSPAVARDIWNLRALLLQYLRSSDPERRSSILGQIRAGMTTRKIDELCQMLPHLPPVNPDKAPPSLPRDVIPPVTEPGKPRFAVQVPPDYHHGRTWPLLVVLHASGESHLDHAAKWSKAAAEQGYILLAPLWELGGPRAGFAYSPREHDAVIDAIAEARKAYNVDSDRVFLFGLEAGGNAAFDIGLSHPDIFAGVMPMSGGAFYFSQAYWRNAQNLPFYVVNGDYAGELNARNREIFTNWAGRSFPMLWVQYKGRGIEWFSGEIPNIFDWMRPKKRNYPMTVLGTSNAGGPLGAEFRTSRPTDNHFYWLKAEELSPTSQNTGMRYNPAINPATVSGWIDSTNNKAYLKSTGCTQMKLLITRNAKGESVLRLDKPVTIQHQLRTIWNQRKAEPSLETLLEDQRSRGDRLTQVLLEVSFKP